MHLSTVELRCKLQEKLHRVTWPLRAMQYEVFEKLTTLYFDEIAILSAKQNRVIFSCIVTIVQPYGATALTTDNKSMIPTT